MVAFSKQLNKKAAAGAPQPEKTEQG